MAQRCYTRASIYVRSGRCTPPWPRTKRSGTAGPSATIPTTRSPRWWPARPTRRGLGHHPAAGPEKWRCFHPNDNPYPEAQFKTLKYHPGSRAGSPTPRTRRTSAGVFRWYNNEHRHGGIGLLTPQQVHLGRAPEVGKPAEGRGAPGGGLDQPRTPRHVRQWSGSGAGGRRVR